MNFINSSFNYFKSINALSVIANNSVTQTIRQNTYTQSICQTSRKLATSRLGQVIFGATKENVAEFVGYYAMAAATSPIVSHVTGQAMKQAGYLTGGGVTCLVGLTSGIYTFQNSQGGDLTKMAKAVAIVTATALPLILILPETMAMAGTAIGTEVGSYAGTLMGGILGGYIAIKLSGSKEELWNSTDMAHTYALKTTQTVIGLALLQFLGIGPQSNGALKLLTDQMVGSLIYNALDISEMMDNFFNKKSLDRILPRHLSSAHLITNETHHVLYVNAFTSATSSKLTKNLKIERFAFKTIQDEVTKNIQGPLMQEMANFALKNLTSVISEIKMIQKQEKIAAELINQPLQTTIQNVLNLQENHLALQKNSSQYLLNSTIKATNQYLSLLESNEEIKKAHLNFNTSLREFLDVEDPLLKAEAERKYKEAKKECETLLIKHFESGLFSGTISELTLDLTNLATMSIIQPDFHSRTANLQLDQLQENLISLIDPLVHSQIASQLRSRVEKDTEFYANNLGEKLAQTLQQLEVKTIGFTLTSTKQSIFIRENFSLHFPIIAKLIQLNTLSLATEVSEADTKKFYLNFNELFWENYTSFSPSLTNLLKNTVKEQISNANLI